MSLKNKLDISSSENIKTRQDYKKEGLALLIYREFTGSDVQSVK